MNQDSTLATLWLAALKSRSYRQGQAQLVTPNGAYCCLGVACDVASRHGLLAPDASWDGKQWYRGGFDTGSRFYAVQAAGVHPFAKEDFLTYDEQSWLSVANDADPESKIEYGDSLNFYEIALCLEHHPYFADWRARNGIEEAPDIAA